MRGAARGSQGPGSQVSPRPGVSSSGSQLREEIQVCTGPDLSPSRGYHLLLLVTPMVILLFLWVIKCAVASSILPFGNLITHFYFVFLSCEVVPWFATKLAGENNIQEWRFIFLGVEQRHIPAGLTVMKETCATCFHELSRRFELVALLNQGCIESFACKALEAKCFQRNLNHITVGNTVTNQSINSVKDLKGPLFSDSFNNYTAISSWNAEHLFILNICYFFRVVLVRNRSKVCPELQTLHYKKKAYKRPSNSFFFFC